MAQGFKYKCSNCDWTFKYLSGGARMGYFRTYYCYDCLTDTNKFYPYESTQFETPSCHKCKTENVLEVPDESCPLCGGKKLKVLDRVLID